MRVCDRCGAEIKDFSNQQAVLPMVFVTLFDLVAGDPQNSVIDLCADCQTEFREKFMKNADASKT